MNKELYVSSTPHETKVALVEDDQLAEIFYERDNEYTLAGSVYKGRVTRVLPGMQSAFVDIGLERDAFLYVSDFLELTDEEDSEEFGEIPTPATTVNLSRQTPLSDSPATTSEISADEQAEFVAAVDSDASEEAEEETEVRESTAPDSEEPKLGEGARRWRGRRRRGGRRGGRDDRPQRTEPRSDAVEPVADQPADEATRESRPAPHPYTPIVLPGESISKYRNVTPAAAEVDASDHDPVAGTPVEDFIAPIEARPVHEEVYEEVESVVDSASEPADVAFRLRETMVDREEHTATAVVASDPKVKPIEVASAVQEAAEPISTSESTSRSEHSETAQYGTIEVGYESGGPVIEEEEAQITQPAVGGFLQHSAPSEAPEGRTLEHETLEDDEMEFHPVPENIEALREVAAEERGETRLLAGQEDEEDEPGDEEANGRAELRAAAPTAAYQQRQVERGGYDRRGPRRGRGRRNNVRVHPHRPMPLISDLLKEGQEILIQIAKEPIAKKGARITSHIALPGRFLVYMPTVNHVGVSRKINSEEERQRLKRIVTSERENGLGGFIVRTAAANIKEEDLRADIRFLKHLWAEIKNRADTGKSPALIYHDLNLVERVLRDQVNADFSQIWVDTEDEYERVVRFANRFQPSLVRRIKLYTKNAPLFEHFGIQDEINNALKSKVWLKSGGSIVINQTEALVAIDVNTGKYVGKTQRLEDTIVKTNVDAIKEIVRQIRLRDLGGIIVIDFIDMDERKNRQK